MQELHTHILCQVINSYYILCATTGCAWRLAGPPSPPTHHLNNTTLLACYTCSKATRYASQEKVAQDSAVYDSFAALTWYR